MSSTTPETSDLNLTAACHCGLLKLRIPARPAFLNNCGCSVCYKYGVQWCYFKRGAVAVEPAPAGEPAQVEYVRADAGSDGSLRFVRCGHCGCVTSWVRVGGGDDDFMGVNARLLSKKTVEGVEQRYVGQELTW